MSDGVREGKKVGEGGKEGEISKEHKEEKGREKGGRRRSRSNVTGGEAVEGYWRTEEEDRQKLRKKMRMEKKCSKPLTRSEKHSVQIYYNLVLSIFLNVIKYL